MQKKIIPSKTIESFVRTHGTVTSAQVAKEFKVDSGYASISLQALTKRKTNKLYKMTTNGVTYYSFGHTAQPVEEVAETLILPEIVEHKPEPEPIKPVAIERPVLATAIAGLVEQIATLVESEVTKRLERAITDHIKHAFDNIPSQIEKKITTTILPTKRLPKIMVVGLLPQQAGMMQKEFSELLDLTFITADEKNKHTATRVAGMDNVLVMTGFVNHAIIELIKSNGGKPEWVNGGMTKLRDMLMEISCAD